MKEKGAGSRQQTYLQRWQKEYRKAAKSSLRRHLLMTLTGFGMSRVYLKPFLKDWLEEMTKKAGPCPHCGAEHEVPFLDFQILGHKLVRVILEHAKEEELRRYEEKLLLVKLEEYLEEEGYDNPTELARPVRKEIGDYWDPHDVQAWRGALDLLAAKGLA